jgi:uncharacterized membrane protein (DUF373 family)
MERIDRIKAHYNFTADDIKNLVGLRPEMEAHKEEFVSAFYNHIKDFENAHKYLKNEEIIGRHKEGLRKWFVALFSGEYGKKYFNELHHIGLSHVNIHLSAHYVNAAIHFVKRYTMDIVKRVVEDERELPDISRSVDKIIDINLDAITSAYMEEEKRAIFLSRTVESYLITFANRFAYGLNLVLVLGLVAIGVLVIGLFVYDLTHLFQGDLEKGLLSTIGSMLMLWIVIELMDNEIRQLRGGKFAIKVFISVALVAVIRKILITTISAEAIEAQVALIAALAVLGVVYWLIARLEE